MLTIERVETVEVERVGDTLTLKIAHAGAYGSMAYQEIALEFARNRQWPAAQSHIASFAEAVAEVAAEGEGD